MKIVAGIVGILMFAGGSTPPAVQQDGHKLYAACSKAQVPQDGKHNSHFDHDDYYAIGYCDGIVQGVSEALGNQKRFCLPKNIRFSQLTQVVVEYLQAYPGQRDQRASQAAYNAFLHRYPCMKKPSS